MMTAWTAWIEELRARNAICASASYGATMTSTPASFRACAAGKTTCRERHHGVCNLQ